tara:strand:+ start:1271 stop:2785 length:1515 start_codon:yes stop_codon:yes gene_type:complete
MIREEVVVIGAGIAGLTSAAMLSKLGLPVTLIESHIQSGGCAGTFKRKNYIFDVGATQVAGFENGGIHSKIFNFLEIPLPKASILDPACVVDLDDGTQPIKIWYESTKWIQERKIQFPGSEKFWSLCTLIHQSNWKFANNNPVLPIGNFWDLSQFLKALIPQNILTGTLLKSSMFDLLKICGSHQDHRLIEFLNLQLKLYSQENVYNTPALYGCTVLQMPQNPHGLWHLNQSMQVLSQSLEESLRKTNAKVLYGQTVTSICFDQENQFWRVHAQTKKESFEYIAKDIVYAIPPQSLLDHLEGDSQKHKQYEKKIRTISNPSGAVVFYSAISRNNIKKTSYSHYQFKNKELGSLFLSLSQEGDGRAPLGEMTLVASLFTDTKDWFNLSKNNYLEKKKTYFNKISLAIESKFEISSDKWIHRELATPVGFKKWTNRPNGIVGGLGQNLDSFGLFGLTSRTPFKGLWLCGDSIYPGEGTAGVSQSALMVTRQILAERGMNGFNLSII